MNVVWSRKTSKGAGTAKQRNREKIFVLDKAKRKTAPSSTMERKVTWSHTNLCVCVCVIRSPNTEQIPAGFEVRCIAMELTLGDIFSLFFPFVPFRGCAAQRGECAPRKWVSGIVSPMAAQSRSRPNPFASVPRGLPVRNLHPALRLSPVSAVRCLFSPTVTMAAGALRAPCNVGNGRTPFHSITHRKPVQAAR